MSTPGAFSEKMFWDQCRIPVIPQNYVVLHAADTSNVKEVKRRGVHFMLTFWK